MEYAVVKLGGKQYKVKPGDKIEVDRIPDSSGKSLLLQDVLLLVSEDKLEIGRPILEKVTIQAKILEQKKGDKIRVSKFKAKSRYRRTIGFKPHLSVLEIGKVETKSPKTGVKKG